MAGDLPLTDERIFAPRAVVGWTCFSLAAGSVNAAAFLACRSFVTHVTGTVTNLGVDAGAPNLAAEYGLVVGAFLVGAMVAVLMFETIARARRQLLAIPFLVVFCVLVAVALAGGAGHFGPFGERNTETPGAFMLLALLAGAMGLQNAAVALGTGNAVRTTHMTGPMTDLAGNLVRATLGRGRGSHAEARWAMLRLIKMTAFVMGAGIAAKYAAQLEYSVFVIPAGFVVVAMGFTFAPDIEEDETTPAHETETDAAEVRKAAPKSTPETERDEAA